MSTQPSVSIVVPCRNEERYIVECLDSILACDYPHDRLEVLVVDGMSDDGTRATLTDYATRHPEVRVLDNPRRITPVALNIAIRAASGGSGFTCWAVDPSRSRMAKTVRLSCLRNVTMWRPS